MASEQPFIVEKAFVLGAGLGTRLRTLTEHCPKPLIPIFGKPLITFAFDQLIGAGVKQLVVNTHHCHEAYEAAFPESSYRGTELIFVHEPALLETAGGIKNVERFFSGGPFIVYNGDVLSNLPLKRVLDHHARSGNEVTLALRSTGSPLHISLEQNSGRVVDIANRLRLSQGFSNYLFTGIYVIEPRFFERIPPRTKISVIPIFMDMIKDSQPLGGVVVDEGCWWDLGTREKYLEVHASIEALPHLFPDAGEGWPVNIDPTAQVAADARLTGLVVAGAHSVIESGARLADCVLWEGARVSAGSELEHCIVTTARQAAGVCSNTDF